MAEKKQSEFIGMDEAASMLGVSKMYLYRLTCRREVPFYKPTGHIIRFDREELADFIRKGRVKTNEELEEAAAKRLAERG